MSLTVLRNPSQSMNLDPTISDGPDTIKILLTTDNHVGYKESDPIRTDDAWKTFNEIIQAAKSHDVDMILHGGDLFDVNKPSKKSFYRVMECLRAHCMGDKPCELELLSDYASMVGSMFPVNYEDPNLNVSIPIFGINGNHDDATGSSMLLPMDVLSVSGFINMFGKVTTGNDVTISPILLQKGTTKFALYGIGHMKDDRLFRLYREGRVKFLRPKIQTEEWFNLMCVHQNHAAYSKRSYLPEHVLPEFLDFVYWGHEHECNTVPSYNELKDFYTLLAGSSVITSLSDGEARPKHVFILRIKGRKFNLEAVPLKTSRPFLLENVCLLEEGFDPLSTDISKFLTLKVEQMITKAIAEYVTANSSDIMDDGDLEALRESCPLPLIRVKVDVSGGFEVENLQRLSRKFIGRVANIDDIFVIHKKTSSVGRVKPQAVGEHDVSDKLDVTINSLISEFVGESSLHLLPELGLSNAVSVFIDKDEKSAITEYIKTEISRETKMLLKMGISEDESSDPKAAFRVLLNSLRKGKLEKTGKDDNESEDELMDMTPRTREETPRERKSAQRKSKETRETPGRKRPVSSEVIVNSDSDMDEEFEPDVSEVEEISEEEIISEEEKPSTRGRAARGTRGTRAARGARGTRARASTRGRGKPTQGLLGSLMNIGKR